jgi:hypothetical protein
LDIGTGGNKSDLDTVLRAMEQSGEIAGPVAKVDEKAQQES